jgi:ABC-type ATPase involved in cell division
MTEDAVFRLKDLQPGEEFLELVNVSVKPGQFVLWVIENPNLYSLMWDLVLGLAEPVDGRILWFNEQKPSEAAQWEQCAFLSRLGWVAKTSRLLSSRTLLNNLTIYFEYTLGRPAEEAEVRGLKWLERAGLSDKAHILGENLPAGLQPIALLVQALAREPMLFFLDRPKLLFEADFSLAWKLLTELRSCGLALIIFDYSPEPWALELATQEIALITS